MPYPCGLAAIYVKGTASRPPIGKRDLRSALDVCDLAKRLLSGVWRAGGSHGAVVVPWVRGARTEGIAHGTCTVPWLLPPRNELCVHL